MTGASLAPRTDETLNLLQERRPQEQIRPIPEEMLAFTPRSHCNCRRRCSSSASGKPSWQCVRPGCSNEILHVCLDDGELLQLHLAAQDFARGEALPEVSRLFMMPFANQMEASLALSKALCFVVWWQSVCPRQHNAEVENVCAPFQFAMSTRAGTDCVGHAVQPMSDFNPRTTVLSIDGIGACYHVLRSAILSNGELPWSVAFRQVSVLPTVDVPLAGGGRASTSNSAV